MVDFGEYFGRPTPPGADVNTMTLRGMYPTAPGTNLGGIADAANPMTVIGGAPTASGSVIAPTGRQVAGKPLAWWTGMLLLVVGIFFAAKKTGSEDEFKNIRASTYNVALITFVAVLGITLLKIVAVRLAHVPGFGGFASVVIAA